MTGKNSAALKTATIGKNKCGLESFINLRS
jgi:hypothetical protein